MYIKKPLFQNRIIVKGNLYKEIADKSEIKESASTSDLVKGKAIIIDISKNQAPKRSPGVKLTYTIQYRDGQRLKRDGVLRVYNINEPIEIPVTMLLGKWKKSHIGVTLTFENEEWHIEGGRVEHKKHKEYSFMFLVCLRLLRFVFA